MSTNNGGPAFPNELIRNMTSGYLLKGGMTLRDYAGIKMMAALVSNFGLDHEPTLVAQQAAVYADAWLAEREKGGAK